VGSRTDDKLKEIDELRDGLSKKLTELEERFPLAGFGKKAALALVGSTVSAPALAWGMRRLRGGGRKKKRAAEAVAQPVTVNVFPKSLTLVAVVGVAAWAGTKVYESYLKTKQSQDASFKPAVVRDLATPERGGGGIGHSGAGN
jgi:hypothetical protein